MSSDSLKNKEDSASQLILNLLLNLVKTQKTSRRFSKEISKPYCCVTTRQYFNDILSFELKLFHERELIKISLRLGSDKFEQKNL